MKRRSFNLRPNVQEDLTRTRNDRLCTQRAANGKLYIHDGLRSTQDQVQEPKNHTYEGPYWTKLLNFVLPSFGLGTASSLILTFVPHPGCSTFLNREVPVYVIESAVNFMDL